MNITRDVAYGSQTTRANLLDIMRPDSRAALPVVIQISSLSAPTLIVHGQKDDLVPIAQAKAFHAALEQAGVQRRLVVIPEGNHFINETHMPLIQTEILDFFRPMVQ
jgi:pimeloyl-ACP methyl ester carboxylesterase